MQKTKKKLKYVLISLLIASFSWAIIYINSLLPIATGYSAKYLCSAIFISKRTQADVEALDLHFSIIQLVRNKIDTINKSVISSLLWHSSKAIYREGLGSTLITKSDENELSKTKYVIPSSCNDTIAWPMGNRLLANANTDSSINNITTQLIDNHNYGGNILACIVLHKGIPIAERYANGINKNTRLLSWSMAKSFTNALAGIMVKEKNWEINQPTKLAQWQNDNRKYITLNNLMQMQSGLKWNEEYGTRSDVTLMLHCQRDFAQYAINQPLEYTSGSKWSYSSGSTNIINYLMRQQFSNDIAYYNFSQTELFNKIGIQNAIFEVDASGTQVGSSYIYATARDYARFGLLYLQDGMFNGTQLLPKGWVGYTTTPASDSKGGYGAFFWLNRNKYYPSAPTDMYACNGHDGQRIFIIPSKEMVIVILGYSPKNEGGVDFDRLLKDILQLI